MAAAIAGRLLNQTGLFAAKGDARLSLGSLDNRQGTVVANNLDVQLNGLLNNQHGTVRGEARLDLKAGQVDNSEGGRISSGQSLNASVSSLDQHKDGRRCRPSILFFAGLVILTIVCSLSLYPRIAATLK